MAIGAPGLRGQHVTASHAVDPDYHKGTELVLIPLLHLVDKDASENQHWNGFVPQYYAVCKNDYKV